MRKLQRRVRTAARLLLPPLPARPAKLLATLTFRCNNSQFLPVMDALTQLDRYKESEAEFYASADKVPREHVVPDEWREPWSTNAAASSGSLRAVRAGSPAHGDTARRIWIEGASTWRNPDEELPAGFDANRGVHYRELSEPATPPLSLPTCSSATWPRWRP